VAEHGGRPVSLAEYRVSTVRPVAGKVRYYLSVAVVGLHHSHTPQTGPGRLAPWYAVGTDLLAYRQGRLEIPSMLPFLDELTAIAAQLDP